MEQLIEKKRAKLRAVTWLQLVLLTIDVYLYMCVDVSAIVPCNIVHYEESVTYDNEQHHYAASVTVEYHNDLATVEFEGKDMVNTTDYYSVGTMLACRIYPYRYNIIDTVFVEHYNYDIDKNTVHYYPGYEYFYGIAYVLIFYGAFCAVAEFDFLSSIDLDHMKKTYPDAFKVREKEHDLKLSIPVAMILANVFLYTTCNWIMHRNEPCVITKYEDVLHDYSGTGFQDAQNYVRVNIDVQVVTADLYVGTAHVTVYEGSASNISEIRDYYKKGQTMTCKIYPSRLKIIGSVSVLHHDEDKTKNLRLVQPKFDRLLFNIMLSATSAVVLYYVQLAFYKKFQEYLIEKQLRDNPQPLTEISTSTSAYKEPVVLNN
jgi:hypothetical protein